MMYQNMENKEKSNHYLADAGLPQPFEVAGFPVLLKNMLGFLFGLLLYNRVVLWFPMG